MKKPGKKPPKKTRAPGGGRKPIGDKPKVTRSIALDQKAAEILDQQPNRGLYVERLIFADVEKTG